jgi:hypothetical protein
MPSDASCRGGRHHGLPPATIGVILARSPRRWPFVVALLCAAVHLGAGVARAQSRAQMAGSARFAAQSAALVHEVGDAAADGRQALVASHAAGMIAGTADAADLPRHAFAAVCRLTAGVSPANALVATFEAVDAKTGVVIAARTLRGLDFPRRGHARDFAMLVPELVHAARRLRVRWHGKVDVKFDWIAIRPADPVALFVDRRLHGLMSASLANYESGIESRFPVDLIPVVGSWESPAALRAAIAGLRRERGIVGAVLVGDLPMHRFFMHDFANPNPVYFEDPDSTWEDRDRDGFDDAWAAPIEPKLWVACIRAGAKPDADAAPVLKDFLCKVYDHWTGRTRVPWRALSLASSDWQGSAAWFADTYATRLFGDRGTVLDAPLDTRGKLASAMADGPYAVFRMWAHSDQDGTHLGQGAMTATDMARLPNKALVTFHLGCHGANYLMNSPGALNNALAWVLGDGIGEAVIGNVRTGTFYGEQAAYEALVAGDYLGSAYLAAKRAGEAEMARTEPIGRIVAGNILLGNPFVQLSDRMRLPEPVAETSAAPARSGRARR